MAAPSGSGFHSRHAWLAAVLPASARRFRVSDPAVGAAVAGAGGELVERAADVEIAPAREVSGDAPLCVVSVGGGEPAEGSSRPVRAAARAVGSLRTRAAAQAARRSLRSRGYPDVRVLLWDLEKRQELSLEGRAGDGRGLVARLPLDALVVGRRGERGPTLFETAAQAAGEVTRERVEGPPRARVSGTVVAASEHAILRVAVGPAGGQLRAQQHALERLRPAVPPELGQLVPWLLAAGRVGLAEWSLEPRLAGRAAPPVLTERLLAECLDFLVLLFSAADDEPTETPSERAAAIATAAGVEEGALQALARRTEAALAGVPRGFAHGDFWTENLLLQEGRLVGVVDWDRAGGGRFPLHDLFHLRLHAEALRTRRQAGRVLADDLLPVVRAGGDEPLRSYCRALGLPPDAQLLESLLAAYWLDWISYELRAYADRDRGTRPVWTRENVDVPLRALAASA